MIVSANFSGRLGNILLEITNAFILAKELHVDFDNVLFKRWYVGSNGISYTEEIKNKPKHKDYLVENRDIIRPIYGKFLKNAEWQKLRSDHKNDMLFSTYGCDRKTFLDKQWPGLLSSLFYDKMVFEHYRELTPEYYEIPDRTVALHVRRTDYSVFKNGKLLQTSDSINAVIAKHSGFKVVVFSDDIEWCKESLTPPDNGELVFHPTQEVPACADLIVMSNFKNVIPNVHSSYSMFAKSLSHDLQQTGRFCW